MRLRRVAALLCLAVPTLPAQLRLSPGDSVRAYPINGDPRRGRVAGVDRGSLLLDDGTSLQFVAMQRVEVGWPGRAQPGRQISFGLLGGVAGGLLGATASRLTCDCALLDLPGLTGGLLVGAIMGGRKRDTRWFLAWSREDSIPWPRVVATGPPRVVSTGPAIEPAGFSRLAVGDRLRVWTSAGRHEGRFSRVDADAGLLQLTRAAASIALADIDVIERRAGRPRDMAAGAAFLVPLGVLALYSMGCSLSQDCSKYGEVAVGSVATGIGLGAILGSLTGRWEPYFSRVK